MKLTIELTLTGGEPIPSSETEREGHNQVRVPQTPDTRLDTLRGVLQSVVDFVERKSVELSTTSVKDPGAPFREPAKVFGNVAMTAQIED